MPTKPGLKSIDCDGAGKVLAKEMGGGELCASQKAGQQECQQTEGLLHYEKIVQKDKGVTDLVSDVTAIYQIVMFPPSCTILC